MMVYIVTARYAPAGGDFGDRDILGVFAKEEDARKCIVKFSEQLLHDQFYRDDWDYICGRGVKGLCDIEYQYMEYRVE